MTPDSTVLITGAGGFIGGRIAEVLYCSGYRNIRAGVRRWSSAARVGRLPIEIALCDVTNRSHLQACLKDVSAVVHCAVGSREVTVGGTKNLLEAALANGVRRFVHLSTIDVYGDRSGEMDETCGYHYTGSPYGDSKIEAEKLCWRFHGLGLPVSILRPTIVYGPFSAVWTVDVAERLLNTGRLPLAKGYCQGTCNLLYIDDLVAAVLLALHKDEAVGEAYNVNGSERPTWHDYFLSLNRAMGLPEPAEQTEAGSFASAWIMNPVRKSARFALNHFESQIMAIYKSSGLARRAMRRVESMIRKSPTTAELRLYGKRASFPSTKAGAVLGYRPQVSMADGVKLCAAWLEHHGFVNP